LRPLGIVQAKYFENQSETSVFTEIESTLPIGGNTEERSLDRKLKGFGLKAKSTKNCSQWVGYNYLYTCNSQHALLLETN